MSERHLALGEVGPDLAPCRSVRSAVSRSQHIATATASRSAGFLN